MLGVVCLLLYLCRLKASVTMVYVLGVVNISSCLHIPSDKTQYGWRWLEISSKTMKYRRMPIQCSMQGCLSSAAAHQHTLSLTARTKHRGKTRNSRRGRNIYLSPAVIMQAFLLFRMILVCTV